MITKRLIDEVIIHLFDLFISFRIGYIYVRYFVLSKKRKALHSVIMSH